jgi:hypothetical protein
VTTPESPAVRYLDTLDGAIQSNEPTNYADGRSTFVKVEAIYHDVTAGIAAQYFDTDAGLQTGSWWLLHLNNVPTWILEQTTPAPTGGLEKRANWFVHGNELPTFETLDEAVDAIARAAFYWEFHASLGYEQPRTWTPSRDYRSVLETPPL